MAQGLHDADQYLRVEPAVAEINELKLRVVSDELIEAVDYSLGVVSRALGLALNLCRSLLDRLAPLLYVVIHGRSLVKAHRVVLIGLIYHHVPGEIE